MREDVMDVIGRILLAVLFVAGAAQKAMDPAVVMGLLAGLGWPVWLVWPALGFNVAVAVALLLRPTVFIAALAAAAYCVVTSIFHLVPGDGWQMSILIKNWALAGGFLVLAAAKAPPPGARGRT
jgi:putative oxidoreductase